jgi:hypothetical protein
MLADAAYALRGRVRRQAREADRLVVLVGGHQEQAGSRSSHARTSSVVRGRVSNVAWRSAMPWL